MQSTLSVLGVALGIAAIVAVNVANHSARTSFIAAAGAIEESATHIITDNVSDDLYQALKLSLPYPMQPIVRGQVLIAATGQSATIVGIDPIANLQFQGQTDTNRMASENVMELFDHAFSAFATPQTLEQLGIELGQRIAVRYGRQTYEVALTAVLETSSPIEEQSLTGILLTDIAVAQTILNMRGQLSSVQLQLENAEDILAVESILPESVRMNGQNSRRQSIASVTQAFETNLTAMSLLTLLVALFLLYNTMTFLVMRRQTSIALLQAVGVTHRQAVAALALEALCLGAAASVIGIIAGIELAETLLAMVERSIANLYFPIRAEIPIISTANILIVAGIGIAATLIATLPALQMTRIIQPSFGSYRIGSAAPRSRFGLAAAACAGFSLLGAMTLRLNATGVAAGFIGIYFFIAAYMCLVPVFCKWLGSAARAGAKRIFGARGVLASRALVLSGGRTSVAICALCIAISATIGVGAMIHSFRIAVDGWVTDRLRADFYVSTRGYGASFTDAEIAQLRAIPEMQFVGVANWTWLQESNNKVRAFAVDYSKQAFDGYQFKEQAPLIWNRFQNDGIIVSEPYAWHHGVSIGDVLEYSTPRATARLPVLGIYHDYSSDRGVISMHRDVYLAHFEDDTINSVALFLQDGADLSAVQSAVAKIFSTQDTQIWNARSLRDETMNVFDQTFAITAVLRVLAVIVAVIAVLAVLAMMQIDRVRELQVQHAIGFTARQIWSSASIESFFMGLFAGLLSIPVGLMLSWLLIWVINQRSFGWTMQLIIDPALLSDAVLLASGSALLAGLIPAYFLSTKVARKPAYSD